MGHKIQLILTDHVSSTREGNVFTGVCRSVQGVVRAKVWGWGYRSEDRPNLPGGGTETGVRGQHCLAMLTGGCLVLNGFESMFSS